MSDYENQVQSLQRGIDLEFWRKPEGVNIPDDNLRFLLIPDAVEAAAMFELAKQVHEYQKSHPDKSDQITSALMVTMGGLLPSVLLFDHLVEGRYANVPKIDFGTIGVSLYKGPGERYDNPLVQHGISIPVSGRTVLIIDDLADYGGTMNFLKKYVSESGARKVLTLAMYIKPAAQKVNAIDFCFGETPQDTWIITPRERVETLVKRVPVWKASGASETECHRRLVDLIGYPPELVDYYLPLHYKLA
ncbi:MAG: hypoxanthine phosphoribosyltransferase [Gammaproteobacteria bacterium]|jgi:hypoxanthine phosphoribosyltransferase